MEYWEKEYLRIIQEDKANKERYEQTKQMKLKKNKKLTICHRIMKASAIIGFIMFFVSFPLFCLFLAILLITWIIEPMFEED